MCNLIKHYKPAQKIFKVDTNLVKHGITLQLPTYYFDFNPIEMISAIMKELVKRNNMCTFLWAIRTG